VALLRKMGATRDEEGLFQECGDRVGGGNRIYRRVKKDVPRVERNMRDLGGRKK